MFGTSPTGGIPLAGFTSPHPSSPGSYPRGSVFAQPLSSWHRPLLTILQNFYDCGSRARAGRTIVIGHQPQGSPSDDDPSESDPGRSHPVLEEAAHTDSASLGSVSHLTISCAFHSISSLSVTPTPHWLIQLPPATRSPSMRAKHRTPAGALKTSTTIGVDAAFVEQLIPLITPAMRAMNPVAIKTEVANPSFVISLRSP